MTEHRLVGLAEPPPPPQSSILGELLPPPAVGAIDDPERAPTLAERRAEAQTRLDNLKAGAADAALRGEKIDGARIVQAEAEVDALDGAEALAAERAAVAAAEADRRLRVELRAAIAMHAETRLRALARAQEAFENGIAAVKAALDATAEIRRLGARLGKPPATVFDDRSMRLRLSQALARLFGQLGGDAHNFGSMSWLSLPLPPDKPTWGETGPEAAAIRELLSEDVEP